MTSERPADPRNPVLDGKQDMALAFGAWFASASPDEIRKFVAANAERTRALKDRGELTPCEQPPTWEGTADPWATRTPGAASPEAP